MYKKNVLLTIAAAVVLSSRLLLAQNAISSTAGSLARSSITAASAAATTGSPDPSTEVMVRNRARVLGDRLSADGTRYFSVADSDLRGKTPDQVLQRLSPSAISTGDHVRQIDIEVNLNTPLTVFTKPGQSIDIGTAQVDGAGVHSITVNSMILTDGITIISK